MSTSSTLITDLSKISALNRGPLTAVFTPAATCLSTLTFISDMYFGHRGAYFDPACFPTSISSSQTQQSKTDSWAIYYYSPGQCPSGWSHATTHTSSFPGADESSEALSLGAYTTAVVCCPSGYTYPVGGQGHQCQSTVTDTTLTYFSPSVVQNSIVQGSVSTTVVGTSIYTIFGDGIPVWWQNSDLAAFSAASLTTSSSSSSTPASTAGSSSMSSTPTATGTPSPSPSNPDTSGLSTGVKAAIGVCIPVAFIAIVLGLFWYFRNRRRKQPHYQVPPGEEHFRDIDLTDVSKVQSSPEILQELPQERPVVEMYSDDRTGQLGTVPHELPSTFYR